MKTFISRYKGDLISVRPKFHTHNEDKNINVSDVSVTRMVRSIIADLQPEAERKLNQITFEPNSSHIIQTDEELLILVLSSLFSLSNNYTNNGHISFKAIEDSEHLLLVITDESRGKANLKKMDFIRWENNENILNEESSENISYFFCWQLVNRLGGWMQVKSGKKGNFVSITLKKSPVANRIVSSMPD